MAKKVEKSTATGSDIASVDPFGRIALPDWFERWPEFFGRRFPEGMRSMPFLGEGCLMEQFTDDDGTPVRRAELPALRAAASRASLEPCAARRRLSVRESLQRVAPRRR